VLPSDSDIHVTPIHGLREGIALSVDNERDYLILRLENPNLWQELENQETL